MKTQKSETAESASAYIEHWLQSVDNNTYTMSQRKVLSLEKRGVTMEELVKRAKAYGLHLLLLKDDKGNELIAAGKDEFVVLC